MPKPRKGENKKSYINRCIPQLVDEGKPQDQAVAICYSMWERKNEDITKRIDYFVNEFAKENRKSVKGFNFETKKDKTSHAHNLTVDDKGNGKTTSTKETSKDHIHKVFEWNVQPSNGHIHAIKENKK